jgi:hypothetical protein
MPKNILECTGRYNDLVRNGIGGNLNKVCANDWDIQLYCNQPDVDTWNAAATSLFHRVRAEWNATAKEMVIPPEVVNYITQLEKDYCTTDSEGYCEKFWLPESSWYDVSWNAQAAATIAKWCARAACALELLDNVRNVEAPLESGQENTELPEAVAEGLGDLAGGLGGLAGGVGDAIGGLGKGAGDALGGLGQGLAWLPIAIGTVGLGVVIVGGIYLSRREPFHAVSEGGGRGQ